jgi:transcriptional regulator with XRE-family HTH domain
MSTAEAWVPEDTFGARLALIRQRLGLNITQAGELCGINEATWRTWERGVTPRGLDRIVRKIATATRVDPNWLMWGGALSESLWIAPVLHSLTGQLELHFGDAPTLVSV